MAAGRLAVPRLEDLPPLGNRRVLLRGAVGHISTGGGATLELVESGGLPGLRALWEGLR